MYLKLPMGRNCTSIPFLPHLPISVSTNFYHLLNSTEALQFFRIFAVGFNIYLGVFLILVIIVHILIIISNINSDSSRISDINTGESSYHFEDIPLCHSFGSNNLNCNTALR